MEKLRVVLILAWALVRTLLTRLMRATPGLAAFRSNYAADRLPPVTPDERRLLPTLSGCIACGLCDVGEGVRAAASGGSYVGTMDLMLATSRSMPDYDAAVRSFAQVSDERLAELEARCPAAVPMRKVAAFVRAKAAEVADLGPTLAQLPAAEGMITPTGP
jgi:succinate dehydrogenase/fumarate reductase-like Fe-S protein